MNTLVIDASVAGKWFLPAATETDVEIATALLKRYADGQVRFIVPDLFWAELGNIFWKAVRQGRWSRSDAEQAISMVRGRSFPSVSAKVLLDDAFTISTSFSPSVYDSLYVALAVASKSTFVTADERLANSLAAHLPVKWLGALA